MSDKTQQLMLAGLSLAVAEPSGLPLIAARSRAGLFPATSAARSAAQQCKDAGYLHVVATQTKGKSVMEICAITEKGIAFLLSQVSPKQVLERLVASVEARGLQVGELIDAARQCQATLEALKTQAAKVLSAASPAGGNPLAAALPSANGSTMPGPRPAILDAWKTAVIDHLARWHDARPNEDCPLPELYRVAAKSSPHLSIGQFHDGLRQLHDDGRVYLHPWTGPLYELPEPPYALLVGHVVAYYASKR